MKPLVGGIVGLVVGLGLGAWAASARGDEVLRRAAVPLTLFGLVWGGSVFLPMLVVPGFALRSPMAWAAAGTALCLGAAGLGLRSDAAWARTGLLAGIVLAMLLGVAVLPRIGSATPGSMVTIVAYLLGPLALGGSVAYLWHVGVGEEEG